MHDIVEIDKQIQELLEFLTNMQNSDGSFDSFYLQPYYNADKGWMKFPENSVFDLAVVGCGLSAVNSLEAKKIMERSITFLLGKSNSRLIWSYPPLSKEYILPFDSDSTSLASFFLNNNNIDVSNKSFLSQLINDHNHYDLFVSNNQIKHLPFFTKLAVMYRNYVVKKCRPYRQDDMRFTDFEFSVSCNNLLYLGVDSNNLNVLKELQKNIEKDEIKLMYYPTRFHAYYLYSRMCYYQNVKLKYSDIEVIKNRLFCLQEKNDMNIFSLQPILMLNTLLFLNIDLPFLDNLVEHCQNQIREKKYSESTAYYSSNLQTDLQPGTDCPHTYFGSPAITCSLYLEFLNLYRKKHYGKYYGE